QLYPLSLHDALPIYLGVAGVGSVETKVVGHRPCEQHRILRHDDHTARTCWCGEFEQVNTVHDDGAGVGFDITLEEPGQSALARSDRKSTRLNSSHVK